MEYTLNYIHEMDNIHNSPTIMNKEMAFKRCRLNYLLQLKNNIPRNLTKELLDTYRTIQYEITKLETNIVIHCENHECEAFITCKHCNIKMRKPYLYEIEYLKIKSQPDYSKIDCIHI